MSGDLVDAAIAAASDIESGKPGPCQHVHGGNVFDPGRQRRPVSWRAITRRWISLVPS
jgi:hypothetical protein